METFLRIITGETPLTEMAKFIVGVIALVVMGGLTLGALGALFMSMKN